MKRRDFFGVLAGIASVPFLGKLISKKEDLGYLRYKGKLSYDVGIYYAPYVPQYVGLKKDEMHVTVASGTGKSVLT